MKKFKAILALILCCALVLALLAACSNSETGEGSASSGNESNSDNQTANNNSGASQDNSADEEDTGDADEEVATVEMLFFDFNAVGGDYGEHVAEAINAYTEPTYHVHLNVQWMQVGDWLQKALLIVSSGERLDLMEMMPANTVGIMQKSNQLMDISGLLPEYAPDVQEMLGDYLNAYTYDGKLLGVPTLRNYCSNQYIIMRKDILEELGLMEKAQSMSTWTEYEEILAVVEEAYRGSGVWGVTKGSDGSLMTGIFTGDSFDSKVIYDGLGDSVAMALSDNDGNITLLPASGYYEAGLARIRKWMDAGYLYPDSPLIDDHPDELMKQGVSFSSIQNSEFGVEISKGANIGYELVCPMVAVGMISTSTLTSWGMGVPITAEEPEAAVKIMNAFYTDAYLMNLIIRGVEGVDYEVVDGQVVYPEESTYREQDFLIGNNLLLTPLNGNGPDFYDRVAEINSSADVSAYLGFVLDSTGMDLLIANISAVKDQYQQTLACGLYTPELYQEYLQKLEAAGVQEYLDGIQSQLAAWLAEQ